MIYVYAVLANADVPPLAGLDDAAVEACPVDGLTLAVSEHREQPKPADAAVLRHAHVVEELARAGAAVLPARFGLVFADEASLRREVSGKAAELRAALERVTGCAEVGLRVLAPERPLQSDVPVDGSEYMHARLHETTERNRLAGALHDALTRHARDSTRHAPPNGRLLLSAAYLVPKELIAPFRRGVEELERAHPDLSLVCTGPWPPYSFAPTAAGGL